jgi:hypothetical protein
MAFNKMFSFLTVLKKRKASVLEAFPVNENWSEFLDHLL